MIFGGVFFAVRFLGCGVFVLLWFCADSFMCSCMSTNPPERTVFCVKLQKELPGMPHPPMRGPLGARIYENISQEAWKLWLSHAVMVINEKRLNPPDLEDQKTLEVELTKFLFEGGAEKPAGYVPKK